ncbi:hypothetical protein NP233_g2619 [Leucocoprinus birnbaumii]|uniref:T6SS Phospholipase effector Tle1-like catalytic domain-containing protein n=1 Tax=Leucocoprinus birnbaumii TaxID=56174 RepID=A0AAD5YTJ8_9AGAR|nr:hypothetical protein NP233_g2619 [Leucocoprinus birnbaumii]
MCVAFINIPFNHTSTSSSQGHKKSLTVSSTATAVSNDTGMSSPLVTSPESSDSTFELHDTESIPPDHDHRTLVLCFDGTGDQFDDDNSNIVNFVSLLKKDNNSKQLIYYQAGIGTYTIPQVAKPMMAKIHKVLDTMIGVHLDAHVMSGYEFLMQNYDYGDKIFLFGFSRGAYTARALAGMVHKVGLLPKYNYQQVPFAYKMYSREDETGWKQSAAFKKAFSVDVDIQLLAVWDTVGSVGVIPKRLPFTTFNTHVKHFRQALALDEHRVRFTPNFFNRPTPEEVELGLKWGQKEKKPTTKPKRTLSRQETRRHWEKQYASKGLHSTDVEEVWFSGCHCGKSLICHGDSRVELKDAYSIPSDVGGGAEKNEVRNNLARIPLRWMVRECFKLKTGILFDKKMFRYIGMDPSSVWPVVKARPQPVSKFSGSPPPPTRAFLTLPGTNGKPVEDNSFVNEEEEELADAKSRTNDMLDMAKSWWLLELVPQQIRFQKDDDNWTSKFSVNCGRGRVIPRQSDGIKIHRSVKLRMEQVEGYMPRPKINFDKVQWVD